jgi:hypothetical protein
MLKEKQISIGRSGFVEFVYDVNSQPINIIEWKTASKLKKKLEEEITYVDGLATNLVIKKYLDDGSVVEELAILPNFTGGIINNLTKTLT